MTLLQRTIRLAAQKVSAQFILHNAAADTRMCLAAKYGRASKHCTTTIKQPHGRFHQFCCTSCYSKMHRLPGFVRATIQQAD